MNILDIFVLHDPPNLVAESLAMGTSTGGVGPFILSLVKAIVLTWGAITTWVYR